MPPLFDLQRYLQKASELSVEELAKEVMLDREGLDEYVHEVHAVGEQILKSRVKEEQVSHLLAIVAGLSTGQMLENDEVPVQDKVLLVSIMSGNASFMKFLTLSILCSALGIAAREEWR